MIEFQTLIWLALAVGVYTLLVLATGIVIGSVLTWRRDHDQPPVPQAEVNEIPEMGTPGDKPGFEDEAPEPEPPRVEWGM